MSHATNHSLALRTALAALVLTGLSTPFAVASEVGGDSSRPTAESHAESQPAVPPSATAGSVAPSAETKPPAAAATTQSEHLELPSASEVDEKLATGETTSGEELYDRFLKKRKKLRGAYQYGHIISADPGGNRQEVRFWIQGKDYRNEHEEAVDDLLGKSMMKIVGPNDLEHTGYLYTLHDEAQDEEFMYSPVRNRTSRVNMRGQTIAGTDFSFDDFLVNLDDIEDATYKRLPNEVIDGIDCYVVEADMKESSKSSYTKSLNYLEPVHYVPLRTFYWDEAGVKSKQLDSKHSSIKDFDGVWVATESTMTDLLEGTSSTFFLEELDPNPNLDEDDFKISSLQWSP